MFALGPAGPSPQSNDFDNIVPPSTRIRETVCSDNFWRRGGSHGMSSALPGASPHKPFSRALMTWCWRRVSISTGSRPGPS
jgi:hypothetical protein